MTEVQIALRLHESVSSEKDILGTPRKKRGPCTSFSYPGMKISHIKDDVN